MVMENCVVIATEADLPKAAAEFMQKAGDARIMAFHGQMGAGKTTFITALCRFLGVEDNVTSPTFTIVNEYRGGDGEPIYHFDFYRIRRIEEALDIGLYEYFDSGALCLMEWPEMISGLLPEETLEIEISIAEDGSRLLRF